MFDNAEASDGGMDDGDDDCRFLLYYDYYCYTRLSKLKFSIKKYEKLFNIQMKLSIQLLNYKFMITKLNNYYYYLLC